MKYLIEDIKRWYRDDETGMIWLATIFAAIFACLMINDTWIHPHPGVDYVMFSNDGPLGAENADEAQPNFNSNWFDLNGIGIEGAQFNANSTQIIMLLLMTTGGAVILGIIAYSIPGIILAFLIRRCRCKLRWQAFGYVIGIIVFAHLVYLFIVFFTFLAFGLILSIVITLLDMACGNGGEIG